jgi:hypothetical protein
MIIPLARQWVVHHLASPYCDNLSAYIILLPLVIRIRIEMSRILSDVEIQQLLEEPKPLPANWEKRLKVIPKTQEVVGQSKYLVTLANGHEFRLIIRSNHINPLDFSVILVFRDIDNSEYILRRHNGAHPSRHTNNYEKRLNLPNVELPICCHRHLATERYQKEGLNIDGYAEPASDYVDIRTAQNAMIREAGFILPSNTQAPLFGDN